MIGYLFDDLAVAVDSRCVGMGGSWEGPRRGDALTAYDPDAIRVVYRALEGLTDPVLFDIGANAGSYALLPHFKTDLTVYAFEPVPEVFTVLLANLEINKLQQQVTVYSVALGEHEQAFVPMRVPDNGAQLGLSILDGTPQRFDRWHEIQVPVWTLDSFCASARIDRIDFIKIDTEGSELAILKGGEQTIKQFKPKLLVEYQPWNTHQHGYEPEEIRDLLTGWGYDCQLFGDQDLLCVCR